MFKLRFVEKYSIIPCKYHRRLGRKNTSCQLKVDGPEYEETVRVDENDNCLLIELMKTFCLGGDNTFDRYGGSLTTVLTFH